MSKDKILDSIVDEFINSSRENLDEALQHLENAGTDIDSRTVNRIFRNVHNVKGTSGFLGYKKIAELCHAIENILSLLRNDELDPDENVIHQLLTGLDRTNALVDNAAQSEEMDIDDILLSLDTLFKSGAEEETLKAREEIIKLNDMQGEAIDFELDLFTFNNIRKKPGFLFLIDYDISKPEKYGLDSPAALIQDLTKLGSIEGARISEIGDDLYSGLSVGSIHYDILYSTSLNYSDLAKRFNFEEDEVRMVNKEPERLTTDKKPEKVKEKPKKKSAPEAKPEKTTSESKSRESVRLNVDLLDKLMRLASELVLVRNQQMQLWEEPTVGERQVMQHLDHVTSEMQEAIILTRMQPVGNLFNKYQRIVRELSKSLNKQIEIKISGTEVELDKTIIEALADPLTHIIRNSCDHGIEPPEVREEKGKPPTGTLSLNAYHESGQINIVIKDDGRGIDPEAVKRKALEKGLRNETELEEMSEQDTISLIMMPGFSTVEKVSGLSGRGVGMDVVRSGIEKMGGSLELNSEPGAGTELILRLPLTLAIIPSLIVKAGGIKFALPQVSLEEMVSLYDEDMYTKIETAGDREVFRLRDNLLPIIRLKEVLDRPTPFTEDTRNEIVKRYGDIRKEILEGNKPVTGKLNFAVLRSGSRKFGLIVDEVAGTEEIVVKPMHSALKMLSIYSGSTVMGDGSVALILDVEGIARHTGVSFGSGIHDYGQDSDLQYGEDDKQTVLLFKSGDVEQFAIALPLVRRIEKIDNSDIKQTGGKNFITIEDRSIRVLKLDNIFNVSEFRETGKSFLLLPKHIKKPVGILASELIDIADTSFELNRESYMEDGMLGSAIIKDKMTLFIDTYRLIEIAEPDWFKERRDSIPPANDKSILLVEDNSFFRELVKGYLEADGYFVQTAKDGEEGLRKLKESSFDLIVSDLQMPVKDGFVFIQDALAESLTEAPFIALTALDNDRDRERAIDAGYRRYEIKLEREKFLASVAEILIN